MAKAAGKTETGKNSRKPSAGVMPSTPMKICGDVVSSIVAVYVFAILVVFPLFATDMYFNILVDRYYFFWITTAVMLCVSAAIGLIGLFVEYKENGGLAVREFFGQFSRANKDRRQAIKNLFRLPDLFLILFMLTALISTIFSEWQYEAFWGNMGRYQGFFLWIWYAVAYFMVTRFFRMKRWYLDVALIVGLYLAVWGIQDYLELDPHGWLYEVTGEQKAMFTSSIGNINTYTAVIGVYLALSAVLFASGTSGNGASAPGISGCSGERGGNTLPGIEKLAPALSVIRMLFYFVSTAVFFTAIITGQSDNAVIGVAVLLSFLPFYAWKTWGGFVRYLLIAAEFLLALLITRHLTLSNPLSYNGFWSGILLGLSEQSWVEKAFAGILVLIVIVLAALCIRAASAKAAPGKRFGGIFTSRMPGFARVIWLILGILGVCVIVWLFWDANHGGHPSWYEPYANVFYFNNDWGTHRGHNWSILARHFSEFPLWKKLIGSGPETYGIVTRVYDYQEMMDLYGEIYDSPHNEFLQYLFTTGVLGFVGYFGWIISGCAQAFGLCVKTGKNGKSGDALYSTYKKTSGMQDRAAMAACAFAVLVYTGQSFINISVPIIVGLVIVVFSLSQAAAGRDGND
ncbi:MAG: O-antigen ligase family protein [Eubacteriales bacterium]|nr:O-antigen ligase family protein [Eubacteriales bacterium]